MEGYLGKRNRFKRSMCIRTFDSIGDYNHLHSEIESHATPKETNTPLYHCSYHGYTLTLKEEIRPEHL